MSKKKTLLIVESPGKIKTIKQYAGDDFVVKASIGHIKDLPKKQVGVNTRSEFEMTFVVNDDKKNVVAELKTAAKAAERILIATDPDREGECIAQHLAEELNVSGKCRITFNEITKKAVQNAIANPREINQNKVHAQSTRRVLDRLVGYKLSPYLWKKVAPNTSAGRVQSAALLLISEKEREIRKFVSRQYWTVHVSLHVDGHDIEATVIDAEGKPIEYDTEQTAKEVVETIQSSPISFEGFDVKKSTRAPYPPFTTSTLQQACASNIGLSASETMQVAQSLYEGMTIGTFGDIALITYMRTDSVRSAPEAIDAARAFIRDKYYPEFLPKKPRSYAKKAKNQQDAHEAIRPTYLDIPAEQITRGAKYSQVYNLIRKRFVASQMEDAEIEQTKLFFKAKNIHLEAKGSRVTFEGFTKMYPVNIEEQILPEIRAPKEIQLKLCIDKGHTTQPPKRYSEAQLIKTLEKEGIGRPSTYASIVKNLLDRTYVSKENGSFFLSEMGLLVNDALQNYFPNIINLKFTSKMEENLDKIEDGANHIEILKVFYEELKSSLKSANEVSRKTQIKTDLPCPKCANVMLVKYGKNGRFLACSEYPKCSQTLDIPKNINLLSNIDTYQESLHIDLADLESKDPCPDCGQPLRSRKGKFGEFFGCSNYPACKYTKKVQVSSGPCPKCGEGEIVEKKASKGAFYSCTGYPNCKILYAKKPLPEKCKCCGWYLMAYKRNPICINKECENGVDIGYRKSFSKKRTS